MRQKDLVEKLGGKISQQMVSAILRGDRRPGWERAKLLSMVTGTVPDFWMEASPEQMRQVVDDIEVTA
jgi:transcriptional regulator with XRE-family HTH domain